MSLARASVFPEPAAHITLAATYVLLGVMSTVLLYWLTRAIVDPLTRYTIPSRRTPRYPGEDVGCVVITWGRGTKVVKIICYSVALLGCTGGMYVLLVACYKQGYVEFVGWNGLSSALLLAGHIVWPLLPWQFAIRRGARARLQK